MNFDTVLTIAIVLAVILLVAGVAVAVQRRVSAGRRREAIEAPKAAPTGFDTGLRRARAGFGDRLRSVLGGGLDDRTWEQLEEVLIAADIGVGLATDLVADVRATKPETADEARAALAARLHEVLADRDRAVHLEGDPAVVVVVGVNGVGKTTTIAKLAARFREAGATPILAAADTFRAAADTQLATWADRVGVEVVRGDAGSDPASVAFEGVARAREQGADTVIVDTAGRLQTKKNLMEELGKIVRVLEREAGSVSETLLVLDGTAGQNGLAQAEAFGEVADLTGVVLTKMDGSARGGVAFAVEQKFGVPVKFIGLGESVADLVPFDPDAYVDALLGDR
ncbi:MAG: signal recognition particle-docking protein FtsY [Acidimicrobiia bacterium]